MLSVREQRIATLTLIAVGIFALDQLVLTPVLSMRDALTVRHERATDQLDDARSLLAENRTARKRIRELRAAGLGGEASVSESQLLNSMRSWAQSAGLKLASIRPDRATASQGLHEIVFQAGGEGTLRAVARFLFDIQTADIPIRVSELQIASRTDGADDLTLQLRVSTVWDDSPPPTPATTATPEKVAEGAER